MSHKPSILLMGGMGFIGSKVCRGLLAQGYSVRVLDKPNAPTHRIADVLNRCEFIPVDQSNTSEVLMALNGIETVIHLIHTTVPGSSMKNAAFDLESNVAALAAWLTHLGTTSVKRVIYLSSGGTVYGAPKYLPIQEDHPLEPMSSYGITKLTCEKYVALFCRMAKVDFKILRPSNAYGEGQPTNRGQGILGVFAERIRKGEPLEIWGSGKALRDYVHVDDLAAAVLATVTYTGTQQIMNVSTGKGHSALELAEMFQQNLSRKIKINHTPDRAFDVPDNVLDNSRLRAEMGWTPEITLETGIKRLLQSRSE